MTVNKLLTYQPDEKPTGVFIFGIFSFYQISRMPEHINMITNKKCASTVVPIKFR